MTTKYAGSELRVDVLGIGLLGPGLPDWTIGSAALADASTWTSAPTLVPSPARLPPAERRRAGTIVKLGIAVADQACLQAGTQAGTRVSSHPGLQPGSQAGVDTATLATVFTASSGDGANCNALCEALATPERLVSPTRFTNSVHNASAGYWHIATASRAPSTSLCAHDASFGAGLLEAVSQCVASGQPVLLVAADTPYPAPLSAVRPLPDSFAVALLIVPCDVPRDVRHGVPFDMPRDSPFESPFESPFDLPRDLPFDAAHARVMKLATLTVALTAAPADPCTHAGLETLRSGIPAARSLPLLSALAAARPARVVVEYLAGLALQIDVDPGAGA